MARSPPSIVDFGGWSNSLSRLDRIRERFGMTPGRAPVRPGEADRAVSSLIGITVLVAVTVIIAAVIGSFVIGIGAELSNPPPVAAFSVVSNATADQIEVTHDGGEPLVAAEVLVIASTGSGRVGFTAEETKRLDVTESFVIETSSPGMSLTGWSGANFTERTGTGIDIEVGDDVTVMIIHQKSQNTIAKTTVIAT